jgi:hypothetical protein
MNPSSQWTVHNTYNYEHKRHFVTVTHPYHPLRGQKLEILRAGKGSNVLVRLEGGASLEIPSEYTDYAAPSPLAAQDSTDSAVGLHSLDTLREIITTVSHLKSKASGE